MSGVITGVVLGMLYPTRALQCWAGVISIMVCPLRPAWHTTGGHLRVAPCLGPMVLVATMDLLLTQPTKEAPCKGHLSQTHPPRSLSLKLGFSSLLLALGPGSHLGLLGADW